MKSLKNTFILILLLLGITFLTIREKLTNTTEYYTTITRLNVRTGTGSIYPISFTLKQGDEVNVISKTGGWYKIVFEGKTGYANSKYIRRETRATINDNILTPKQKHDILLLILLVFIVGIIIPFSFKFYRKAKDKKFLETVTSINRGTASERTLVLKLLKYGISEQNIFHDLYVSKSDGSFSQIDLVVVTEVGIIVIEVKDYGGWIYGTGNQSQWTKVLSYGKQKYLFQNPITQNKNHIINLKGKLSQYDNIPYYSVVVFYGDCVLKNINYVPKETFVVKSARVLEVINAISKNNLIYNYTNIEDVIRVLNDAKIKGGISEYQNQHIENINDMLGKNRTFD